MEITGDLVLADRKARKLSRTAYGKLCGLTSTKVRNIEQGRPLKPHEQVALEAVLATSTALNQSPAPASPTDLSGGEGEPASITPDVQGAPPAPESPPVVLLTTEEVEEITWEELELDFSPVEQPALELINSPEPTLEDIFAASTGPDPRAEYSLAPFFDLRGDGVRRFSNGELRTWSRCQRKWYLTHYRALGLKSVKVTGARQLGTRVHAALAAAYDPEPPNGHAGLAPVQIALDAFNATVAADYDTLTQEHDPEQLPAYVAELLAEADLGRAMLEGYFDWLAETGADEGYEVVAPEQILEVDAQFGLERPVHLIAKLDLRLIRRLDGARLFLDHKTAGSLTQHSRVLHLDRQMLHYALCEYLTLLEEGVDAEGVRCGGALYNMLKKVKRTAAAKPPFYDRLEVRHSIVELQNYWSQVRGTVQQILEATARLDAGESHHSVCPPTPEETCTWSCDMFAVCPMLDDGSRAEDYIAEQLVVINPLARYDAR